MTTTVTNNDDTRFLLATTPTPHHTEPEREPSTSTSRRFRTLLHLLASDKSDDDDDHDQTSTPRGRRASFKERVLISCCSCAGPSSPSQEDQNGVVLVHLQGPTQDEPQVNEGQEQQQEGGMNLAEALAVEREFRVAETTTGRVSLMALLEAAEREAQEQEEEDHEEDEVEVGVGPSENNNVCCCVCMVRKKGAAIIPCGHTFCRICAKQVWVNRGSCPLCNKLILDVLNIF